MKFGIHFGALAKPIVTQLRAQGIRRPAEAKQDVHHLQRDADAITRLAVRGYLGDAAKQRMHRKVMRELSRVLSSSDSHKGEGK